MIIIKELSKWYVVDWSINFDIKLWGVEVYSIFWDYCIG